MAAEADRTTEVIIAGGGPVGFGLAIELALRGVASVIVERTRTLHSIPKGQNLTPRTMEHFQAWGAEAALRAARTVPAEFGIGGLTTYRTLLSDHVYDWLERKQVRPFYNAANERLPQHATEAVLRARAAELDLISVVYGFAVETVEEDADGVTVTARDRDSGETLTVRGDYVVGCDGSRSATRKAAGITETRDDHDKLMVLLVFKSQELHRLLVDRYPGKSFFNVLHPDFDGYWLFFGRVDLGNTWFFHAPVPRGTTKENFDFTAYLHRAVGAEFALAFDHIGFWDLRIAQADAYRAGRTFIAGDAAHSHPPYGGYGINTGFEDARNLGWKLGAVYAGWAGPRLLDTYGEERHPVFQSTGRDFIGRSIEVDREFLQRFDPSVDRAAFEAEWAARSRGAVSEVDAYEPHYSGSSIVFSAGETSAKGNHSFAARPGHHLAPRAASGGGTLFDRLGPGFTLIALGEADADISGFEAAATAAGIPLSVVRDDRSGERVDYGAGLILVRPDAYVAWAGEPGEGDAAAILATATGH